MTAKTVYLNGNFLSQPVTGVQRYGIELLRALDQLPVSKEIRFVVLTNTPAAQLPFTFTRIQVKRAGFSKGKWWEQTALYIHSYGKLLITFAGGAPIFKHNQYVAIHDASVYDQPQALSAVYRLWYRSLYAIITKRAKKIITVSQFSSRRLQQALHIGAGKFAVIHDGGDHLATVAPDMSIRQQLPQNKKIVFVVGSLNPYKNFNQVIAAATLLEKEPDIHFVIAGNVNSTIFTGSSHIKEQLAADNITFLGSITDAQLQALYLSARCFLFLSLYEGFGIPVAEALSAGCPVVCSDAACLPELFTGYAVMVNPYETAIIANAVKQLCFDDAYYNEYKKKALSGAHVYTWAASSQALAALINQ